MTAPMRRFWRTLATAGVIGLALVILAVAVFHGSADVVIAIAGVWALSMAWIVGPGFSKAVRADAELKSEAAPQLSHRG